MKLLPLSHILYRRDPVYLPSSERPQLKQNHCIGFQPHFLAAPKYAASLTEDTPLHYPYTSPLPYPPLQSPAP